MNPSPFVTLFELKTVLQSPLSLHSDHRPALSPLLRRGGLLKVTNLLEAVKAPGAHVSIADVHGAALSRSQRRQAGQIPFDVEHYLWVLKKGVLCRDLQACRDRCLKLACSNIIKLSFCGPSKRSTRTHPAEGLLTEIAWKTPSF